MSKKKLNQTDLTVLKAHLSPKWFIENTHIFEGGNGDHIAQKFKDYWDIWIKDDLNKFIATGDYRFTANRLKEIDQSQLVVMTPELLASVARNHNSAKSQFLQEAKIIVFDESHLLGVPSRGDHIEVALMKLTEINPNIRIVMLF